MLFYFILFYFMLLFCYNFYINNIIYYFILYLYIPIRKYYIIITLNKYNYTIISNNLFKLMSTENNSNSTNINENSNGNINILQEALINLKKTFTESNNEARRNAEDYLNSLGNNSII